MFTSELVFQCRDMDRYPGLHVIWSVPHCTVESSLAAGLGVVFIVVMLPLNYG